MQDNAKIYTAQIIKAWFAEQGIVVAEWPPYSPNFNPIEHVWAQLKTWVYKYHLELLKLVRDN
jgi:transposase